MADPRRLFRLLLILPIVASSALGAAAQEEALPRGSETATAGSEAPLPGRSGLPLPRFVSLRAPEANLRTGPGVRYPIEWVYSRRGLPLEIVDEFDTWRRVRDWQGSEGWIHQSMLSGERNALIVGRERLMRRAPETDAPGVARLEAGVVARLEVCNGSWCEVDAGDYEGWLRREEIFGVYPDETLR